MAYNPVAAANFNRRGKKPRRKATKHDGIKHSSIAKRRGVGASADMRNAEKVDGGFLVNLAKTETWATSIKLIGPGNASPIAVSEDGTCVFYVTQGILYATEYPDGYENETSKKTVTKLNVGQSYVAKPGVAYSIASGNSNAETLVVCDRDYTDTIEVLGEGVITPMEDLPNPTVPSSPVRSRSSKAKTYAQKQQRNWSRRNQQRQGRRRADKASQPGASATGVVGVNPTPAPIPEE